MYLKWLFVKIQTRWTCRFWHNVLCFHNCSMRVLHYLFHKEVMYYPLDVIATIALIRFEVCLILQKCKSSVFVKNTLPEFYVFSKHIPSADWLYCLQHILLLLTLYLRCCTLCYCHLLSSLNCLILWNWLRSNNEYSARVLYHSTAAQTIKISYIDYNLLSKPTQYHEDIINY